MDFIKRTDAEPHHYYDGKVSVTEFNFSDKSINDADIIISGSYPAQGYAVNDISLALISIESGSGSITMIGAEPQELKSGDRLVIRPGEAYRFNSLGKLAIRYIAIPAWSPEQARIVEA